jgi:hypothetical protein
MKGMIKVYTKLYVGADVHRIKRDITPCVWSRRFSLDREEISLKGAD